MTYCTTMNDILSFTKNQVVTLSIPAASPIKTLDGNLHEAGQEYKVLGYYGGSFLRLSRKTDKVKLIIEPSRVTLKA